MLVVADRHEPCLHSLAGLFVQRGRDGEQDGSTADRNRSVAFDQFPATSEPEPSCHQIRVRSGNDRTAEKNKLRTGDVSASEISWDIISLYSNESKTIFLLDGWTGKTPAELSILVHEMVHHLQNVGQLKFACPEEREELAYKAQESWLHLFGHDLERDFQMDPFTILVKSKCF